MYIFLSQTKKVPSDSLCPSEDSKGLWDTESSKRAEHPLSNPPETRILTFFSSCNPQIKTAKVIGHIYSSCSCCWIWPTVGLLPACHLGAFCVWAQLIWIARECSARQAGCHSSAQDLLTPPQAHARTKPLFVSCVATRGWRGKGQAPSVGRIKPKQQSSAECVK